jgi:AAA domain, putative AbiEii toxin, Type IV TA system
VSKGKKMPTLTVNDFSCLKEAVFDLAPVNVIIGPQGSGKSVTTKMLYFFADILANFLQYAERQDPIDDYKRIVAKQFSVWFPPSAWGNRRFNITYTATPFSARILRRTSQGKLSEEVSVTFSEWFSEFYVQTSELFERLRSGNELELADSARINDAFDRAYRVRDIAARKMQSELGNEYISQQTFIPAGRAFFTSIGKLVAGFEQAGNLDPVTLKFAKLFSSLRDRQFRRIGSRRVGPEFIEKRLSFMNELFGGEIRYENDLEFVESVDGRKIPFSSLSSGQQELLPMWSIMDYFNELDAMRMGASPKVTRRSRELVYIEEPEAHLFPSAQSLLMEFLIGSVVSDRKRSLIITTHSPYIMSKLNVFLKAGQLARRKKRNQDINEIVSRECWLTDAQLSASAIEGGRLRNLIDDEGLIDATYLDDISEQISREFSDLLQIESEI